MAFGTGGMGRVGGVSVMGRSGGQDPDSNYFLYKQQLADSLLRNAISAPQKPELSWTQGAARLAEALAGSYKSHQLENQMQNYQSSRAQDMQTLASALQGGGNMGDAMSQLQNPSMQNQLMQMMMMKNQQDFMNQKAMQQEAAKNKYAMIQDDNKAQNQGIIKNAEQQGDLIKEGYKGQIQQNATLKQPIAQAQQNVLDLTTAIQNPNTPPDIKAQAQTMLDGQRQALTAMHPPAAGSGGGGNPMALPGAGGVSGASGAGGKGAAAGGIDLIAASNKAKDSLAGLNQVQQDIESGRLTNLMLTPVGEGIEQAKALAGQPNSMDSIGRYKQLAANSTVQALGDIGNSFKNAGIQARITKPLVDVARDTTFAPNEMLDSAYPKIAVNQQVLQRAAALGDIAQQYSDKNGGNLINPDKQTGLTFEQIGQNFNRSNPVLSFPDWQKKAAALQDQKSQESQSQPSSPAPMASQPIQTPSQSPDPSLMTNMTPGSSISSGQAEATPMASPTSSQAPAPMATPPAPQTPPDSGSSMENPGQNPTPSAPISNIAQSGSAPMGSNNSSPSIGGNQQPPVANPLQLAADPTQGNPQQVNGVDPQLLAQYLKQQQAQQPQSLADQMPQNLNFSF
jgi:hypothetical protein